MSELVKFKRGVYTPEEQAALDAWVRLEYNSQMPPMPPQAQPRDMDVVSGYEMYYYAKGWDPWNPLYYDYNYARNTRWGDVPVLAGMREPMGMGMLPSELGFESPPPGDASFVGDGYDFELYYYKPIFSGDTFHTKKMAQEYVDLTEDGSTTRFFITCITTDMFNQREELVCRAVMHWPCFLSKFADGHQMSREELVRYRMEQAVKDGKPARYLRPAHRYTDADWNVLRDIWSKEVIRGKDTLYWEDVHIGDEPPMTAESPVTDYDARRYTGMHHAVGAVAGDTVRDFVMGKRVERRFQKREDGVIWLPESERTHFLNFVGRNFCRRLVTNWMGDDGMIRKMGWRMVNDYPPEKQFNHFPEGHFRESWLLKVPYLKEAGRFTNTHGMGPDCALVHGYVTDKWVEKGTGDHLVMLTVWCEDMDGNIFQECEFSVVLPTRGR